MRGATMMQRKVTHTMLAMTRLGQFALLLLLTAICARAATAATPNIVADGQPNAEIITAEQPKRAARLAATELQAYIEKISGAQLPIVTAPTDSASVKIYVGESEHAAKAGVTAEGLQHGAYRIVSGDDWLALIGYDEDFQPVEPWARHNSDWEKGGVREAWIELAGNYWRNPVARKSYRGYNKTLDLWKGDKKGSLNAVYGYLRSLGVRWYMPGELGEIVPTRDTIALPDVNKTVRPDVDVRTTIFDRYGVDEKHILWALRLGVNTAGTLMHHGIRYVTEHPKQYEIHPEYYALTNGRRQGHKTANACLSSLGLFRQNVAFVRTIFDHYDASITSVMPHDGLVRICECRFCDGKATRDRGRNGWYSDYVWQYVNRVAKELATTHPDRKIICGAYSTYQLPPANIETLRPNVLVGITNGRPRWTMDDAMHEERNALREAWLAKTPNKLSLMMNHFIRGGRPGYLPHVIARGVRDWADHLWRDELWVTESRGLYAPSVNHLIPYVTSRFWWDADRDIDALLAEYYTRFYGPAAPDMEAFIEYCEAHYLELTQDKDVLNTALSHFDAAKAKVSPTSVYGKRIALIDEYLTELQQRREQLNKGRTDVPGFRAVNFTNKKWNDAKENFTIDGKLDEPFWRQYPGNRLHDLITGETPEQPTRFYVVNGKDAIYFGVRCYDDGEQTASITTTEDGDPAFWSGDHIEILIETNAHSYYQIAINPAGAVIDLDRGAQQKKDWFRWDSQAEVATHVGEDQWTVEVRIPFVEKTDDPLRLVVGNRPTASLPWYFNLCRKRVRDGEVEWSAWSPTGEEGFHHVMKFGKLYSH